MKKVSSHHYFACISKDAYQAGNPYKFSKHMDLGSDKYKKGVATVLDWVSEVAYHYIQKEQALQGELNEVIKEQERYLKDTLPASPYKEGIIKGFSITHEILYKTKEIEEK